MIDLSEDHIETVLEILKKYVPNCEVLVFGSRISGNAKPYSDLDLAIKGDEPLDFDILRLLKESFENSNLPIRVDVLDWHGISEQFQKVIETRCKKIQTRFR